MRLETEIMDTGSKGFSRVLKIKVNKKPLLTPVYFPAVSSVHIRYPIKSLLNMLIELSYPQLLISAYELNKCAQQDFGILRYLEEEYTKKNVIFLDSGGYELFWKPYVNWPFEKYSNFISELECDFYTNFDDIGKYIEKKDQKMNYLEQELEDIFKSSKLSNNAVFVPIIHKLNDNDLEIIVNRLLQKNLKNIFAISDIDCGTNMFERAETISRMRKIIDSENPEGILHVLGTGHPLSILIYAYCGADSFDSLDWIKYSLYRGNLSIYDFPHLCLLNCDCPSCTDTERDDHSKLLLHNLLFYQNFLKEIRDLISDNKIEAYLKKQLTPSAFKKITSLSNL